MKRKSIPFAAMVLALPLLYAMPARGQFVPAPPCDKVSIIGTPRAFGSGCPAGHAQVTVLSLDPACSSADFVKVDFDAFTAEKGPGIPMSESRKQCTVEVNLRIPSGFRFTVADTHYEGFAELPNAWTNATLISDFFIPIPPNVVHQATSISLHGPFMSNFTKEDTIAFPSIVWPPSCREIVPANLRSEIRVAGPAGSSAFITVDQASGKLTQLYGLKWAYCP
jgi:hypothetical protein